MNTNLVDPYELNIRKALDKILPGAYDNIEKIGGVPTEIRKNILEILIKYACESQNVTAIMLARDRIKKIPSSCLSCIFLEASDAVIDFQDEWEYRRLLELVKEAVPDLLTLFIDRGYSQRRLKYEKRQKIFFN
ncbi:hypothetical protein [Paenibacillus sp. AN1007]|uniref:Uncharacterized protein n=1 Tax=Paenibacillus sp. AN1007 TaxID=3151385 RepID=A0AAU8NFW5_9BACL